jgi:hypothetical protein
MESTGTGMCAFSGYCSAAFDSNNKIRLPSGWKNGGQTVFWHKGYVIKVAIAWIFAGKSDRLYRAQTFFLPDTTWDSPLPHRCMRTCQPISR